MNSEDATVPKIPEFPEELWEQCRKDGDFMPIFFELYQEVGLLCNTAASLLRESPAFRAVPPAHYAALTGMLNRCSRLMLANVHLTADGLFGETLVLISRCIMESTIKVRWLCLKDSVESFERYLADGLKKDIELKDIIETNVREREGKRLPIEERMLNSVNRCVRLSGMSESQIRDAKKLPDLRSMQQDLKLPKGYYLVTQSLASHPVHGTWTDLVLNYLEEGSDGNLQPRDHDCPPSPTQFVMTSCVVLQSVESFLRYVFPRRKDAEPFLEVMDSIRDQLWKANNEHVGTDFDIPDSD